MTPSAHSSFITRWIPIEPDEIFLIVLAVSAFVLFLLAVQHFTLWLAYRRSFHLYFAFGWLSQIPYIYFEILVQRKEASAAVPLIAAVLSLILFVVARRQITGEVRLSRVSIEFVVGLALTFLFLPLPSPYDHIGGSIFSFYVYASLGRMFWIKKVADISKFFLRTSESKLGAFLEEDYLDQLPDFILEADLDPPHNEAIRFARIGRRIVAGSFILFGFLQLFYPLRDQILELSGELWGILFVVGMALKLSTGIGFLQLQQAFQTVRELNTRKSQVLEKLAVITASVLHDIGGPAGQIRNTATALKKFAGDLPSKQAAVLLKLAKALGEQHKKLAGVHELVAAMRSPPSAFRDSLGKKTELVSLDVVKRDALDNVLGIFREQRQPRIDDENWRNSIQLPGEESLLVQIFTNLITNAVEARLDAKPDLKPFVRIGAVEERTAERVKFYVEDNGGGIEESVLSKMDRPFVTTKNEDQTENRGLGFYIVCRLVELHGGSVQVRNPGKAEEVRVVEFPSGNTFTSDDSKDEEWTRITVSLPARRYDVKKAT